MIQMQEEKIMVYKIPPKYALSKPFYFRNALRKVDYELSICKPWGNEWMDG